MSKSLYGKLGSLIMHFLLKFTQNSNNNHLPPSFIPIPKQIERLQKLFPDIGPVNPILLSRIRTKSIHLPSEANGWFAIPWWPAIAPTYEGAVEIVITLLTNLLQDKFRNNLEGRLDDRHLQNNPRTKTYFEDVYAQQGCPDVLIISAQLGYKGTNPVSEKWKFNLDIFTIICIFLANPQIFQECKDFSVYCSGDEFFPMDTTTTPQNHRT